jgi:hypothetical protein
VIGGSLVGLALVACGLAFTAPAASTEPPPSAGHALVYHDALASVVLVNAGLGGMDSPSSSARTVLWRWNGSAWSVLDSLGPPIRNLGGAAYDSDRDVLVLFGGSYSLDLVYDETWEWTQRDGWRKREVAGPGKRDHTAMAYDKRLRRTVLHGGQETLESFPSDTWTWDGARWERVATTGPGPRFHHTMVYDHLRERTVLFGGIQPGVGARGDTWSWNGSAWQPIAAPVAPRSHARLGASREGILLIGGMGEVPAMSLGARDTSWVATPSASGPSARYLTAMAYDPVRGVTVLFGGGEVASDRLLADTWEYSAAAGWRRVR